MPGYWADPTGRHVNNLKPWLPDGPYDVDAATDAVLERDHYDAMLARDLPSEV